MFVPVKVKMVPVPEQWRVSGFVGERKRDAVVWE